MKFVPGARKPPGKVWPGAGLSPRYRRSRPWKLPGSMPPEDQEEPHRICPEQAQACRRATRMGTNAGSTRTNRRRSSLCPSRPIAPWRRIGGEGTQLSRAPRPLPEVLRERLLAESLHGTLKISFTQPPAIGARFVHRSHPLVGILADGLLETSLNTASAKVGAGEDGEWRGGKPKLRPGAARSHRLLDHPSRTASIHCPAVAPAPSACHSGDLNPSGRRGRGHRPGRRRRCAVNAWRW